MAILCHLSAAKGLELRVNEYRHGFSATHRTIWFDFRLNQLCYTLFFAKSGCSLHLGVIVMFIFRRISPILESLHK